MNYSDKKLTTGPSCEVSVAEKGREKLVGGMLVPLSR